jgi:hypothetical protein
MSKPTPSQPVKLIMSLLSNQEMQIKNAIKELTTIFGSIDFMSEALAFYFTDYYEEEFGRGLFRHLISFHKLITPDALPAIKLATNAKEEAFLDKNGKRSINIDPGYIAPCHFILATCKGFSHRPYLRDGVYADLTLIFRAKSKSFQPLQWTFPDYGSKETISLLNKLRKMYLDQLKALPKESFKMMQIEQSPIQG